MGSRIGAKPNPSSNPIIYLINGTILRELGRALTMLTRFVRSPRGRALIDG